MSNEDIIDKMCEAHGVGQESALKDCAAIALKWATHWRAMGRKQKEIAATIILNEIKAMCPEVFNP